MFALPGLNPLAQLLLLEGLKAGSQFSSPSIDPSPQPLSSLQGDTHHAEQHLGSNSESAQNRSSERQHVDQHLHEPSFRDGTALHCLAGSGADGPVQQQPDHADVLVPGDGNPSVRMAEILQLLAQAQQGNGLPATYGTAKRRNSNEDALQPNDELVETKKKHRKLTSFATAGNNRMAELDVAMPHGGSLTGLDLANASNFISGLTACGSGHLTVHGRDSTPQHSDTDNSTDDTLPVNREHQTDGICSRGVQRGQGSALRPHLRVQHHSNLGSAGPQQLGQAEPLQAQLAAAAQNLGLQMPSAIPGQFQLTRSVPYFDSPLDYQNQAIFDSPYQFQMGMQMGMRMAMGFQGVQQQAAMPTPADVEAHMIALQIAKRILAKGEAGEEEDVDVSMGLAKKALRSMDYDELERKAARKLIKKHAAGLAANLPGMKKFAMPKKPGSEKPRKARDPATINKVQQCAISIMKMVGTKTIFERQIREALGNNPDTSKALRLLMTQGKLERCGVGGRGDPFSYKATPLGLDALQDIIINALERPTGSQGADNTSGATTAAANPATGSQGSVPGLPALIARAQQPSSQ